MIPGKDTLRSEADEAITEYVRVRRCTRSVESMPDESPSKKKSCANLISFSSRGQPGGSRGVKKQRDRTRVGVPGRQIRTSKKKRKKKKKEVSSSGTHLARSEWQQRREKRKRGGLFTEVIPSVTKSSWNPLKEGFGAP